MIPDNKLQLIEALTTDRSRLRTSLSKMSQRLGGLLMIDPEGNFCKVWNIVLMFLLIYTATYMPFKLAFISDADTNTSFIVDNVVDFMFMFDMCVNFNMPIRNKDDTYEFSRKIVAMTYLKSWFFIDLMASLPMTLI